MPISRVRTKRFGRAVEPSIEIRHGGSLENLRKARGFHASPREERSSRTVNVFSSASPPMQPTVHEGDLKKGKSYIGVFEHTYTVVAAHLRSRLKETYSVCTVRKTKRNSQANHKYAPHNYFFRVLFHSFSRISRRFQLRSNFLIFKFVFIIIFIYKFVFISVCCNLWF